jgi:hypothetical protein
MDEDSINNKPPSTIHASMSSIWGSDAQLMDGSNDAVEKSSEGERNPREKEGVDGNEKAKGARPVVISMTSGLGCKLDRRARAAVFGGRGGIRPAVPANKRMVGLVIVFTFTKYLLFL